MLINEIAWAGTLASAHDEWIELHNPSADPIAIDGWLLTDDGDLAVVLQGRIEPYSYFLLERTDESTIADLAADMIYTGSLRNDGEQLRLLTPSGSLIDSANLDGGNWPAGDSASRASMERVGGRDQSGNWRTYTGVGGNGHDAAGLPIQGTPRQPNSIFFSTPTPAPAQTPSTTPTPAVTAAQPGSILINEIAWAGTVASSSDEWLELYNPGEIAMNVQGWTISDGGDIQVELEGEIQPGGFYLLERTDDSAVANIPADLTYSGSLSNGGEVLRLVDPMGNLIDVVNGAGGAWPAGDASSRASMERLGGGWGTFTSYHGLGIDANGQPVRGTPRGPNSLLFPTPVPTWIPGKLVINEVLIRPHYDWQGTGGINTGDEFIELINLGPGPVNLGGMLLDDLAGAGSSPHELPSIVLEAGCYRAFFRSRTHLALNDGGDTVRLLAPDGRTLDQISYLRVRAYNLSYGRYPDGSGHLVYGLWPTPGQPNLPFDESPPVPTDLLGCGSASPERLARLARFPGMTQRLRSMGFSTCVMSSPVNPDANSNQ
ncbi:MAG: lamin tail domain-containing protein [Anaerolineales bacterium]